MRNARPVHRSAALPVSCSCEVVEMKYLYKYGVGLTMMLRVLVGGRIFYVHSGKAQHSEDIYPSIAAAKAAGAGERYFDWIFTSLRHQEPVL